MNPPKRLARHKVNFENPNDLEAVVLAKLGMANEVIHEHAKLSDSQIQYRLTKAKNLEGLPHGQGYRSQWRTGRSELAQEVMQHMVPQLRKEVKATLPKLIQHPTPETVKEVDNLFPLTPEVKRLGRQKAA